MNDSFFKYLQQLELLAFFSGYPIVYALISVIKGNKGNTNIFHKLFVLLPFAYAFVGILFLGLQLNKFYPHYKLEYISAEIQIPFLTIWGLITILFFIPFLYKRPLISLLHSFVFFFAILQHVYSQVAAPSSDNTIIKNYLRVYSTSIILNLTALLFTLFVYWIINLLRKKRNSVSN